MEIQANKKWILWGLALLSGFLVDFIVVGIFKIIWIVIYAPTYLALAMTLETRLRHSKFRAHSKQAVVIFICGAIAGHLIFVNRLRHDRYSLKMLSTTPLLFQSVDFPEYLYVTSDEVSQALSLKKNTDSIFMESESLTDYDCVKSFTINRVNDIDVRTDPKTAWTLRYNKVGVFTTQTLPSLNDHSWPWCKISFYRTTTPP